MSRSDLLVVGVAGVVDAGKPPTTRMARWWPVVVAKGEKPPNELFRLVGGWCCQRGGCREATNEPDDSLVVEMGGQVLGERPMSRRDSLVVGGSW